jgi:hypothetical protein
MRPEGAGSPGSILTLGTGDGGVRAGGWLCPNEGIEGG